MKICLVVLKILSGNEISASIKGHSSGTNVLKIMCNNPKVDFVCFVALRPKSTAMFIAGRSVHLTTLFPGQA